MRAYRESLAIHQKLAEAHPTAPRTSEAWKQLYPHRRRTEVTGEPAAALKALESALEIFQRLAHANPIVADSRSRLAFSHNRRGRVLWAMGRHAKSEAELRQAGVLSRS